MAKRKRASKGNDCGKWAVRIAQKTTQCLNPLQHTFWITRTNLSGRNATTIRCCKNNLPTWLSLNILVSTRLLPRMLLILQNKRVRFSFNFGLSWWKSMKNNVCPHNYNLPLCLRFNEFLGGPVKDKKKCEPYKLEIIVLCAASVEVLSKNQTSCLSVLIK